MVIVLTSSECKFREKVSLENLWFKKIFLQKELHLTIKGINKWKRKSFGEEEEVKNNSEGYSEIDMKQQFGGEYYMNNAEREK